MREILFRGKRESDGKWIYGLYSDDYVHDTDFPCIMPLRSEYDDGDWSVIRETVGQYTGLKDKNGKMIFEGDIIKNKAWYVIEFKNCGYGLVPFGKGKIIPIMGHWNFNSNEVEIIGNVHDNPELLEAKS